MNTEFKVVIPARYASSRFPGKPLIDLAGKPMIQHVYEQTLKSAAQQVVIATDDQRIAQVAEQFGATVCMTRDDHDSGTDRIAEVCQTMNWSDETIVVNVQGDEPLIPPENINQVARNLAMNSNCSMSTLAEPIDELAQVMNPNCVKAVFDESGKALYFSRAPIPYFRDGFPQSLPERAQQPPSYYRHIGIYGYRVSLLKAFVTWSPSTLEQIESLEQLRVMSHGHGIHIAPAAQNTPPGVDTPDDVAAVLAALETA
ncbi:MAG: 3-deoxy-manno-octulosonate cytidylyltransferase [Pseudomonadota bacterium]|nr:3-deoxy-manno-octulosonate cytidylyltransferase [Pseudomonadota bacterium]